MLVPWRVLFTSILFICVELEPKRNMASQAMCRDHMPVACWKCWIPCNPKKSVAAAVVRYCGFKPDIISWFLPKSGF